MRRALVKWSGRLAGPCADRSGDPNWTSRRRDALLASRNGYPPDCSDRRWCRVISGGQWKRADAGSSSDWSVARHFRDVSVQAAAPANATFAPAPRLWVRFQVGADVGRRLTSPLLGANNPADLGLAALFAVLGAKQMDGRFDDACWVVVDWLQ